MSLGAARRLKDALALDDFERLARSYLPRPIFGYVAGGSETLATLRDNRKAFDEVAFRPASLVNVAGRTQTTTLFGRDYSAPFGIAPVGFSALTAFRGDLVLAGAAERAGIPMIMSGASLTSVEEVAAQSPHIWFQAYLTGEADWISAFVGRVRAAGVETLVVTIDMPVISNREHDIRNGFKSPLNPSLGLIYAGLVRPGWTLNTFLRTLLVRGMPHFENFGIERGPAIIARNLQYGLAGRDHLDWSHIDLIRRLWKGRLVLKGVMSARDAMKAREAGVDGIIVSNHGGRQLDGLPSPMRVLTTIVDKVDGAMPVMVDSGFRRGTDVLKALALGADFVFLGRPFIFAAAIGGEAGIWKAWSLLHAEIDRDMALLGVNRLSELSRDHLMRIADESPLGEGPSRRDGY